LTLEVRTSLSPQALLASLKQVEASLGRDVAGGLRWGPRPIDLDLLLYGPGLVLGHHPPACAATREPSPRDATHEAREAGWLTVPHPRLAERAFVVAPLCDLAPGLRHPVTGRTMAELWARLGAQPLRQLCPVLPFASSGRLLRYAEATSLMGVVNATPDSFTDGGQYGGEWCINIDAPPFLFSFASLAFFIIIFAVNPKCVRA
jgi:2-amino-4-hydroxy-6-hydroxymethyldihydropteridine diphosphokinase